jgi:hypothetical protein
MQRLPFFLHIIERTYYVFAAAEVQAPDETKIPRVAIVAIGMDSKILCYMLITLTLFARLWANRTLKGQPFAEKFDSIFVVVR